MKINVTIDLEDIWVDPSDNSGNFSDVLKEHITWEVQQAVWNEFSEEAKKDFSSKLRSVLDEKKQGRIDQLIDDFFNNEKIRKSPYDNKEITMKDYLSETLKHKSVDDYTYQNKISAEISKQADVIAKQLKDRYDYLFASQLVAKMNETGLLKDDVARILLDNGKS